MYEIRLSLLLIPYTTKKKIAKFYQIQKWLFLIEDFFLQGRGCSNLVVLGIYSSSICDGQGRCLFTLLLLPYAVETLTHPTLYKIIEWLGISQIQNE